MLIDCKVTLFFLYTQLSFCVLRHKSTVAYKKVRIYYLIFSNLPSVSVCKKVRIWYVLFFPHYPSLLNTYRTKLGNCIGLSVLCTCSRQRW